MLLSHARANGSLPIPCLSCLSHRCSVSLLNKQLSLSLSLSVGVATEYVLMPATQVLCFPLE